MMSDYIDTAEDFIINDAAEEIVDAIEDLVEDDYSDIDIIADISDDDDDYEDYDGDDFDDGNEIEDDYDDGYVDYQISDNEY